MFYKHCLWFESIDSPDELESSGRLSRPGVGRSFWAGLFSRQSSGLSGVLQVCSKSFEIALIGYNLPKAPPDSGHSVHPIERALKAFERAQN